MEEEDDVDRKRPKKKTTTSLGDAITVIDEKKYKFLEKQLVQQSEIHEEEVELERKKMELGETELELEKNRRNLMMEKIMGLGNVGENKGGGKNR